MAHGDTQEEKWRRNWRMEWVASTLHTTLEYDVSSITTADAHTVAASSRLNWRPCWFKWTCLFCQKTKSGFCTCAITFRMQSNTRVRNLVVTSLYLFDLLKLPSSFSLNPSILLGKSVYGHQDSLQDVKSWGISHTGMCTDLTFGSFECGCQNAIQNPLQYLQWKSQQDVTVYQNFIIPYFKWRSTCFRRHTAHHQEPKSAQAASGFA
jgi:hypothetical protein